MATPQEMEAYIQTLVDTKMNARFAELSANVNRGSGAKPSKPATYDGRSDPELWLYGRAWWTLNTWWALAQLP